MPIPFARRTHWDLADSSTHQALCERRAVGLPVLDLTASNPTQAGFDYAAAALLAPLSSPEVLIYDPDPRGMLCAREAVGRYYADHAAVVSPEQVMLTTSTSEAYSHLFRLLCDPGDEVLIGRPSYPLFEFLAQISDVRLVDFSLFYDHGWHTDLAGLRQKITPRTRAIILVHPNNPTGHYTAQAERQAIEALCVEHGLALIVDEVFLDYPLAPKDYPLAASGDSSLAGVNIGADIGASSSFACGPHPALTFVLSGLSKIAGLPQMKGAWLAAFGPEAEVRLALARLEVIADTYLSMNAPVQHAFAPWLAGRARLIDQIQARVSHNLKELDRQLARQLPQQSMVSRLEVEAGWYAVLRIPALEPDEQVAELLLREEGVSVYPGSFFGFSTSGWLVLSLLTPPEEWSAGIGSILHRINGL